MVRGSLPENETERVKQSQETQRVKDNGLLIFFESLDAPMPEGYASVSQDTSLSWISVTCNQNHSKKPDLNENQAQKEMPIYGQSSWNSGLFSNNDPS